jgi:hypothetical protein
MKYHLVRSVLLHLPPTPLLATLIILLLAPPRVQLVTLPEPPMLPVTPHMLPTTLLKLQKLQTSSGNVSGNISTFRSIFIQSSERDN